MTERSLKILLLITALGGGGAERQLVLLGRELKTLGHNVTIAVFVAGGQHYEAAVSAGLNVVVLRRRGDLGLLNLARLLRRERFDAAYSFLPESNAKLAALSWVRRSTRIVWGVRASNMDLSQYGRRTRHAWRATRWLARVPDATIANSHAGANYHISQGYLSERTTVIHNGIDTALFFPDPEAGERFRLEHGITADATVVGILGRFDPIKGHDDFLLTVSKIQRQRPDVIPLMVGAFPPETVDHFGSLAQHLGCTRGPIFAPAQTDANSALNAMDLLLHTSRLGEGYSNVLAEARACGVPCLAFDTGDARYILNDWRVVDVRDVSSMANKALAMLAESRDAHRHMSDTTRPPLTMANETLRVLSP